MPTVSVVIVNYNGCSFLEPLFESLARQSRPAEEVILVDNGSSDGSVELVRRRFPWVRLLALETNAGFTEGTNYGYRHASGDLIALLNNDTVVDERWLAELVEVVESDSRVAAAVPKIYLASAGTDPPVIDCAGALFNNLGFCWGRGSNQVDRGQFDEAAEVPGATGCSSLLRREALAGEPIFDTHLQMYYEEMDLSLRLRGRGFAIRYTPASVVHHMRGQGMRDVADPRLRQQFFGNRNRVKLLAKYFPWGVLLRSSPLIALSLAYWNLFFLRRGGLRLFLRAVAQQVSFAARGLAERRRVRDLAADGWLPWMSRHGLRDMVRLRRELGSYTS